jgi:Gpi18-like mannosyltransferase
MHLPSDSLEENKTLAFAQSRQAATRALSDSSPSDTSAAQADAPAADLAPTPGDDGKRNLTGTIFSIVIIASRTKWYAAFKNILPIYIGIHLAFFVLSCLTVLYTVPAFSKLSRPLYVLWQSWHRWDTGNYLVVALHGYVAPHQTAFFPFYPILERGMMLLTGNPFTAGLIISNAADLLALVVLYRLVEEDFDQERAYRAALYLSLFPTALFLAAAYNESLFLCLSLLSFYYMRQGRWWLAGLLGLLATLTRSSGLLLLVPFCFEYLRQRHFALRVVRFDILSGLAIPAGLGLFSLYCAFQFHDPLAFSHAQAFWGRIPRIPGYGMYKSVREIMQSGGILNFQALHNILDLVPDLLILIVIVLGFIGPWKLPGELWAYNLYAASLYLFLQLFPAAGIFPLLSTGRFMLEVFPAYIFLAGFGKYRTLHMSYVMVSGATLCFLLTQFLLGKWVL